MIFQCWNHPVIGPDVWSGATDFEAGAWQCWPQRHWLHSELWTIFFSVQMEVVPLVQCEGSGSPQIGALRVLQTPWSSWHLTTSRFWCYKELNWFVFGMRRSKLDEMTHGLLPHFSQVVNISDLYTSGWLPSSHSRSNGSRRLFQGTALTISEWCGGATGLEISVWAAGTLLWRRKTAGGGKLRWFSDFSVVRCSTMGILNDLSI